MDPLDPASVIAQEAIARYSVDMYAIMTALDNGMPEVAVEIIADIMSGGVNNVAEFIFVQAGGSMGLVEGICALTGTTTEEFLTKAAHRSAETVSEIEGLRRDGKI